MSASLILLTFDSIHDVLRAEKVLKAAGLFCDLVPTPRSISSDCGMSIECLSADEAALDALNADGTLQWRSRTVLFQRRGPNLSIPRI